MTKKDVPLNKLGFKKGGRSEENTLNPEQIEWIIQQKTALKTVKRIVDEFKVKFNRDLNSRSVAYQWKLHQKSQAKKFNETVIQKLASGVGDDFDLLNMNIVQLTDLKNELYNGMKKLNATKEEKKWLLKDYLSVMDRIEKFTSLKFKVQADNKDIIKDEIDDSYFESLNEKYKDKFEAAANEEEAPKIQEHKTN